MKKARITSIPGPEGGDFLWRWEECSGTVKSPRTFEHYFECLVDARTQGYDVELTYASGVKAPGGAGFRLDHNKSSEE